MGEDEEKEHFSLSGILKEEKKEIGGKKKRRKRGKRERGGGKHVDTRIEIVFLISFPLLFQPAHADNFNMDVNDPRFSALFDSHLYALTLLTPNTSE